MRSRWHGDLGSPVLWLPPYLCFLDSNSMLPTASDGGRRVGSLYSNWETHRGGGMWSYCWITFKIFVKHLFYVKPSDMGNKSLCLWSSERSKKFEEVRGAFSCARLQWYCQVHAESIRACNDVIGMSAQEHAMMSLAWVHKSLNDVIGMSAQEHTMMSLSWMHSPLPPWPVPKAESLIFVFSGLKTMNLQSC